MDIAATVKNLTPFEQLCVALITILIGVSGYSLSNSTPSQSILESPEFVNFDPFSDRALAVDDMMQGVIADPTEYNLRIAKNKLLITHWNWSEREVGDNKEEFQEYLLACVQVIDEMQDGKTADTSDMNMKYDKLVNN